jgi:hypothetical protein
VKALQELEHRPVLVVEQPPRHLNRVVGWDADEVLVESSVVNRVEGTGPFSLPGHALGAWQWRRMA